MNQAKCASDFIVILNQADYLGYNNLPESIQSYLAELNIKGNDLYSLLQAVLTNYLSTFNERLQTKHVPYSVKILFDREYKRISKELEQNASKFYSLENDLFLKDLGIVRQKLIPVGAELVDESCGIPRSILFRNGVSGFISGIIFFGIKTKGFKPFYQLHLDPRNLDEFSPDGWIKTYKRLSELIQLNPEVKGFFGASWFYDPALKKVSPHLNYLREVRQQAGARLFYWGDQESVRDMALKTSKTRREMFDDGKYIPSSYFIVWERSDLLNWAGAEGVAG